MIREEELEDLGVRLADEVKTLVIRPGDVLIITMSRRINMQEYDQMVNYLHDCISGVKLIVFPEVGDVRVFRPDGEGM